MDNQTFINLIREEFFLYRVAGDGNCFYSSIAHHYARRNDSSRDTQRQVRMDVYTYVKGHMDEFAGFYESLEEYKNDVNQIKNDREFCPNFAPLATARCYGVNVVVIKPGERRLDWLVLPAAELFEDTIFVSYHNGDHYNYLVPLMPDSARRKVEEKVIRNDERSSSRPQQQKTARNGSGAKDQGKRGRPSAKPNHKEVNPALRCEECPTKTFSSMRQLTDHKRRVHEARLHQCTLCPSIIKGDNNYKRHLINVHPSTPNQHQCRHCGKQFNAKKYLDQHILRVHVLGEFICPECNNVYTSAEYLRQHVKEVHADGHHECDEKNCTAVFKCLARLYAHKILVHVERLHVCTYCEAAFKTKCKLTAHLNTVHSMSRDYACDLVDCGKSFKEYTALIKHQRFVHQKERQHVCDICSVAFQSNSELCRHKKHVHGIEADTETRKRFECKLCTPPLHLSNNASWVFHRLLHHSDHLAPGDPKKLEDVYTSSQNRVFVAGNNEMDHYMQNSNRNCIACNIKFYFDDAQRNHMQVHHVLLNVKYQDFKEALFECRHSQLLKGSREAFNKIYNLSHEIFPTIDRQRKVYDILLLPAAVEEDQIKSFVSTKESDFYVYSGSRSMFQRHRSTLVSPHHTTTHDGVVSTNAFMKITESGPIQYKAFLVNEKYLTHSDQSISCRQLIRKLEAMDIFTLFYFTKRFERNDVFFQTLEYGEMKHLTLEEIRAIIEEVNNSQGILTNLRRFRVNMVKPIKISTEHVQPKDYAFSRCLPCVNRRPPLLVSRFHATKHELITHDKRPETLTEKLLMMPASLNPKDVYDLLQEYTDGDDTEFWVYFAVGSNRPITSIHDALNLNTEGYVGQASGNPISPHHFVQNRLSSALKKLRARYSYVYFVANWKFEEAREMQRAEISLIVLGSRLFQESSAGRPGVILINEHVKMYSISNIFTNSEWNLLYDQSTAGRNRGFQAVLPCFITSNQRIEEIVDITDRIPLDNHSSDDETEENND